MSQETYDLNDLEYYVVLGWTKEGKPVSLRSEGLTVQDMAAMIARANLSVQVEATLIALDKYRHDREMAMTTASPILRPSN